MDLERVSGVDIADEMRISYMDYAMSVIVGRALPDARDGLKPVHRRILYAMFREGLLHNKRYSKSAGVVGEVLKKYHPHGDSAVYDAMVRLAQEWNLRYPLVDGQGNFGSVDGDPAAAYRYTESRLTALAEELLADIDKETVGFTPNFDEQTVEPVVMPTRIPNLIVNGSAGIAVGMATNIPPHNLTEISNALLHLIDHPDATVVDLMKHVPGPDFPTGAIIFGREGCRQALETGRGIIRVRARARIERDEKRDRESIIVTEIPYQVNKAKLIEKIAELVQEKRIEGVSDLRDESDRDGMRIAIELKRDAQAGVVMNQLYKLTPMQSTFGVIQLAIVQGQPRVLSLKEMLSIFVDHRRDVVTRRTRYELSEAEKRLHILEGLKIALDNLDAVIELIKKSASPQVARERLSERFGLSEIQAQAILDMKLQRLTGLEREKILEEHRQVVAEIARLTAILASDELLTGVVKSEIVEIRDRFGDKRRTEIVDAVADIALEDMIVEEDMVVTISHSGYIKRNALTLYRSQRRGGRGVTGMGTKEEDFVVDLFVASTKSYILIFTTSGRLFWLKVHEIPEGGRAARGKAIVNLLKLEPGEKQAAIVPVRAFEEGKNVVMATRRGIVKKTDLMAYSNPRPSGIIGVLIEEGDALIDARLTDGTKDIFIGTADGMSIRFEEAEVRPTGRAAYGVKGIALGDKDDVVAMDIVNPGASILTVTENGFGKRTPVEEYRQQGRAGSGVITIKTSERNGRVIGVAQVTDDDQVMLITSGGQVIRTRVAEIRESGRNTQGVKLINVAEGEKVVAVARLAEGDGDDEAPPEKPVVEA